MSGYIFGGWYTESGFSAASLVSDSTISSTDSDYGLYYAKFTASSYTVTAPTFAESTYGDTIASQYIVATLSGSTPSVTDASLVNGDTDAFVLGGDYTGAQVSVTPTTDLDANTYTAVVRVTTGDIATFDVTVTVTIKQAEGSGTVTIDGWTYGEAANAPVPTSDTNGTDNVTYQYKVKDADDSTYSDTVPSDAGSYTVKATFAATNNYTEAEATADFTIAKAAYDMSGVSFADVTYTYDGTEKSLTITGTLPDGVSVSYADNTLTNVGSTTATSSFTGDSTNYEAISDMTATLTVTAADFDVTASGYSGTYDGEAHSITVTADGATITYSADGETYSSENPEFTDAGEYTVYYIASKANYNDVTGSVTVKIAKAAQDISYADTSLTRTVGDTAFTNGLTETTVDGTVTYASSALAVATVDADGKVTILEAGVTTITATAAGTDNYTAATASYTLTVEDAAGNAFLTQFVSGDITDDVITDDLKEEGYDTVAKITDKLTQVLVSNTDYTSDNMMTLDVTLMISTDGGATWVEATEANFPADGITITIPYPDGTNQTDYDFTVVHMFGMTSTVLGTTAGDTETPAVTKTADGIQVTLKGLSPIAVGWKKLSTSNTEATATTTSTTSTTTTASAKTGDTNPVLPLAGTCAAALVLIAVLAVVRRRKHI
ncbi:MAG: LPXTG cell wall anchor domain-containing protein [Clostridiales bacterium]|nr:LPXTG cell wall anchor domain-containing protein [Clostridiales bacterium]